MTRLLRTLWIAAWLLQAIAQAQPGLEEGFRHPPSSAGISCWWWWLNGNVTAEAITRDLEAMKSMGFSGACIFDAGGAEQRGNDQVPAGPMFGTPPWRALFRHAVQEAERLGLTLSLNIQSGWNLGGPDVTPEEATKHLTWSERVVTAADSPPVELAPPKARDGFYRDIAVLAYPQRPPGEGGPRRPVRNLAQKAVFTELGGSAPDTRFLLEDEPEQAGEVEARRDEVVDLTSHLGADGRLSWRPAQGAWVVLRFGYTCSGAHVSTSSGAWQGRVIDHLSAPIFRRYWDRQVEPLLRDLGPRCGRTLKYLQTDSWELGGVNWTDDFAAEFRTRRGYDPIPLLPIIAGKIIDSRDLGTRFLADFRKTISECVADRHYGTFAALARERGLGLQAESAGPHAGPFDGLKNYGHSEVMMSEFWVPSPHRPKPEQRFFVKQAASAAQLYGKRLVGAESFTSIGPHWNDTLWSSQKPSFDHEVCSGLNLVLLHTFTCSPAAMGLPGQEYFAGTHFNPQVTWWPLAEAPIRYFSRSQWLLQRGRVVTDALCYYGDHVPNIARLKQADPAQVLPGFDFDWLNEDVLLGPLATRDARLTLPHGPTFRLLVLPDHQVLSLAALRKVHALVHAGATVLGPKTKRLVTLMDYPACEDERQRLADELWGPADAPAGERRVGAGRILWGRSAREILLGDGVTPDFEPRAASEGAAFDYIHRVFDGVDLYFVCNQSARPASLEAWFRIAGRLPELWDPLAGQAAPARAFTQEGGRTKVPLDLDPYGSIFVLFRTPIASDRHGAASRNRLRTTPGPTLDGPWQVAFDPAWGAPASVVFDHLVSWTDRPEPGVQAYSGRATYRCEFQAAAPPPGTRLWLDLGEVPDVGLARVSVNGKDCGIAWTPPFRVEITDAIRTGSNLLAVEVANSWRNRLVADRDRPVEQRLTRTNIRARAEWIPLPAGLLGPVTLLTSVSD